MYLFLWYVSTEKVETATYHCQKQGSSCLPRTVTFSCRSDIIYQTSTMGQSFCSGNVTSAMGRTAITCTTSSPRTTGDRMSVVGHTNEITYTHMLVYLSTLSWQALLSHIPLLGLFTASCTVCIFKAFCRHIDTSAINTHVMNMCFLTFTLV